MKLENANLVSVGGGLEITNTFFIYSELFVYSDSEWKLLLLEFQLFLKCVIEYRL